MAGAYGLRSSSFWRRNPGPWPGIPPPERLGGAGRSLEGVPAYLDHAATTPLRPEAAEAMRPFLTGERFGNPSGSHAVARAARTAIDEARVIAAEGLGCK